MQQQGQTFFLLSIECIMNWGEWYPVPNKVFVSSMKAPITFSKALADLKAKNKVLPDSMVYFPDFGQIRSLNEDAEKLKKAIVGEIRKNDFDNDLGPSFKNVKNPNPPQISRV